MGADTQGGPKRQIEVAQEAVVLARDERGDTLIVEQIDELKIFAAGKGWVKVRVV